MSSQSELPHFVRKQVERATARLQALLPEQALLIKLKGPGVLIQQLAPHPAQARQIKLPIGLLLFTDEGWLLLFRTSQGTWQALPGDKPGDIEAKIDRILQDDYGVFFSGVFFSQ